MEPTERREDERREGVADYPLRPPGDMGTHPHAPEHTARGTRAGMAVPGFAALAWMAGIVVLLVVVLVWIF